MRNSSFRKLALAIATLPALLPAFVPPLHAADSDDVKLLREQLRALEQKILVLERKQEIKDETAAAAAPVTPKITVNDKGFTLASADGANSVKIRGLVQLDSRLFFNDGGAAAGLNNNAFVLRRARLISEGQFAKNYSFQIVTEFGGSSPAIVDASLGVQATPGLQVKFGRFKSPVGLELLQSDSWTFFNERSIVTNLVPNRDLGILATGDVLGGTLNYSAGVVGGVPDAASTNNADFDNEKDFVGRLFFSPFKNDAGSVVQGLSFGVSGSYGREKTASGRASGYRTDGQQTFFSYSSAVLSDGASWRVSPQLDYRFGSFGLLGEYVLSTVNLRPTATGAKTELQNKAWQLAAGYVLTGENSSYNGVVPNNNFSWADGTWGAFEVAARVANLKVDDAAFPTFASISTNVQEATSYGVGLNWYLSKVVRFTFDYYQTKFDLPVGANSTSALLRQDEKALVSRFQLSF